MSLRSSLGLIVSLLFSIPVYAASCMTQAQMTAAERNDLAVSARILLSRVQNGDVHGLKAGTLPAVAADFSGIASSVEQLHPLIQRATVTVDDLYDLDASADPPNQPSTQFFCGSPTVVLNFSGLPPGKYALAILHATGVPQPQQISFILAHSGSQWQLAGFFAKPMVEAGHDGPGTGPRPAASSRRTAAGPPGSTTAWPPTCSIRWIASPAPISRNCNAKPTK